MCSFVLPESAIAAVAWAWTKASNLMSQNHLPAWEEEVFYHLGKTHGLVQNGASLDYDGQKIKCNLKAWGAHPLQARTFAHHHLK